MADGKKSYYAIIPANVRYDQNLTANAKLLYGEITALCNEKGYCWATNAYFAELYGMSKKTISAWVTQLASKGYISITMEYKGGSREIVHRYIRICGEGMEEIVHTPMEEKVTDNNTKVFNSKSNNTSDIYTANFEDFWKHYPKKIGKKAAYKAWQSAKVDSTLLEKIMSAVDIAKDSEQWRKNNGQFIPNPATWLNQGRWDDEITCTQSCSSNPFKDILLKEIENEHQRNRFADGDYQDSISGILPEPE